MLRYRTCSNPSGLGGPARGPVEPSVYPSRVDAPSPRRIRQRLARASSRGRHRRRPRSESSSSRRWPRACRGGSRRSDGRRASGARVTVSDRRRPSLGPSIRAHGAPAERGRSARSPSRARDQRCARAQQRHCHGARRRFPRGCRARAATSACCGEASTDQHSGRSRRGEREQRARGVGSSHRHGPRRCRRRRRVSRAPGVTTCRRSTNARSPRGQRGRGTRVDGVGTAGDLVHRADRGLASSSAGQPRPTRRPSSRGRRQRKGGCSLERARSTSHRTAHALRGGHAPPRTDSDRRLGHLARPRRPQSHQPARPTRQCRRWARS